MVSKKILAMVLCVMLLLSLCACSGDTPDGEDFSLVPIPTAEQKEYSMEDMLSVYNSAVQKILDAESYHLTGSVNSTAVMGDVIDVLNHRNNRRDIDWSEPAQLADMETEVSLYWYLRGAFEAPGDSEKLSEGACIVGPACRRDARVLADKLGAQILLPVLR